MDNLQADDPKPEKTQSDLTLRLPTELLLRIVELVLLPPEDSHVMRDAERPATLPLASVCQRWRQAVLHTPSFWTSINLAWRMEAISMFLERSGTKDLSLYFEGGNVHDPLLHLPADAEWIPMSRVQTFSLAHLTLNLQDKECFFWKLLNTQAAPSLEKLYICGEYSDDILESSIFTGETPTRLRYLWLSDCTILPDNPLFHAPITHLRLTGGLSSYDDRLIIVDILAKLPTLKYVMVYHLVGDFVNAFFNDFANDSTLPPIYLPGLERLIIYGHPLVTRIMLSLIHMPVSTKLDLRLDIDVGETVLLMGPQPASAAEHCERKLAECRSVLSLVNDHLAQSVPPNASFYALRISEAPGDRAQMMQLVRPQNDTSVPPAPPGDNRQQPLPPILYISIGFPLEPNHERDLMFNERVLRLLPYARGIRQLFVSNALESATMWRDGFSYFANIEDLVVEDYYFTTLSLVSALKSTSCGLFPRLARIELWNVALDGSFETPEGELDAATRRQIPEEYRDRPLAGLVCSELAELLKEMNAQGPRLKVYLRGCSLSDEALEMLNSAAGPGGLEKEDILVL
ncbi:hypothetical protein BDW22DRAFT_1341140 [Trametopsis cervina]|nr:hypothetical protein BDW22DRAFT_1341140 [Trametopsis cervina]